MPSQLQDATGPLKVTGGGSVVLGQDQDEQLGGTDKHQSFNGFIVDMFLTQSLLMVQDMTDYINCDMDRLLSIPYLLDFLNITEHFTLGAETVVAEVGDVCRLGRDKWFSVFPEPRTNAEAKQFCSTLNGSIATPLSADENIFLANEGSHFKDKCTEFDKENGVWVGMFWDPEERLWKDQITLEESTFRNFKVEVKPSSGEKLCVMLPTLSESPSSEQQHSWDIESCGRKICTVCQFERPLPLRIRGLCAKSLFDRSYFIYDTSNFRPIFNGVTWSRMEWGANNSWVLYQMDNPSIKAQLLNYLDYPVGVHDYVISGDKCPGKVQRLKFTSCGDNTFTCGNGDCIDISQRCNLELDCEDHSDELNCETLIIPVGYDKRLPPPMVNSRTPTEASTEIAILLIRKLDLLDSQLALDLAVKRTWFDSRIQFKNLHFNHDLNQINDLFGKAWFPEVTLVGSDDSHVTYTVYIDKAWGQRSSNSLPDDDTIIDEGS